MMKTSHPLLLLAAMLSGASCGAKSGTRPDIALSPASGVPASQAFPRPENAPVRALRPDEAPDEMAVAKLLGKDTTCASLQLRNLPDALLVDRVFAGLEAAGRVLTLEDGRTVTWGFKHREANLQTVLITAEDGGLELVAVVDDVLSLTAGASDAYPSVEEYERKISQLRLEPRVVGIARDQASLIAAYPLLKRWMQANLLGFNSSCEKHAAACALMPDIHLPIDVYLAAKGGSVPVKVVTPDLPAASIPLEAFTR